jgi:PilZ domain
MAATQVDREKRVGLHLTLDVAGQDAAGAAFHETSRTLNISGGGVLFESHRNLLVGSRLTLAIQIPDSLRKHFGNRPVYHVKAVICRVESFEGEQAHRIGARFLGESE